MEFNALYVIPARGGSKGIPGKNIKLLNGKPLINYSIDVARKFTTDNNICVSTDSAEIIDVVETYGVKTFFKRPENLASDFASTYDVLLHAYTQFLNLGIEYTKIVLLQPTSPFRKHKQLSEAMGLYHSDIDMVVSVCKSDANPYYNLFIENEQKYIVPVIESTFIRRQDIPDVYSLNGSIYIINVKSLLERPMHKFNKVVKYEMDRISSVDLDTEFDWRFAEFIIEKKYFLFDE